MSTTEISNCRHKMHSSCDAQGRTLYRFSATLRCDISNGQRYRLDMTLTRPLVNKSENPVSFNKSTNRNIFFFVRGRYDCRAIIGTEQVRRRLFCRSMLLASRRMHASNTRIYLGTPRIGVGASTPMSSLSSRTCRIDSCRQRQRRPTGRTGTAGRGAAESSTVRSPADGASSVRSSPPSSLSALHGSSCVSLRHVCHTANN